MQATKQQLHQIWLKCMQMNQCTPQVALAFLNQIRPVINTPLTYSGQTLLMLAASISSIHLVKALISFKSDITIKDQIGRSALHYAAAVGNIQIFQILVKCGSDPLQQTIGGQNALTKACLFGQSSIIQWYLNNYIHAFQVRDRTGQRPLDILKNTGDQLYNEVKQVYEELMRVQMKE